VKFREMKLVTFSILK